MTQSVLSPRASEHEIAAVSQHFAARVRAHLSGFGRTLASASTTQELNGTLNGIAAAFGVRPVGAAISLSGRVSRMVDPSWWRRSLRPALLLQNERQERAEGNIRKYGACYVSDWAMKQRKARDKANRATLEALEVVNGNGEALNLAEVADASVSNPKLRRSELMVRCRGFEETAKYMGHQGVFLTLTCPSRFHRFNAQGETNTKWQDAGEPSARDAQKYLCTLFARIRAEWKRKGFNPYGFRVAEPHHDGCPHWHILLFAPGDQIGWFEPRRALADRDDSGAGLVGIAGTYALEDCGNESGAVRHRFTVKNIDPAKGSATGYIAKYIAKNIDGQTEAGDSVGLDFASGKSAETAAQRVRTWASLHRIRQFQQIGGPSVTVWRELRRLGKDGAPLQLTLFEGPRAAADRALWALFWVLQGGPDIARRDLTLKPFYVTDSTGKYGDEVTRVKGVHGFDTDTKSEFVEVTRMHEWTVQRAGLATVNAYESDRLFSRDLRARRPEFFLQAERSEAPWTGVNNCTESESANSLLQDFPRTAWLHPEQQRWPHGPLS